MQTLKQLGRLAKRLYRDDRGAEGLEKLLIIGAIVLPLLAILILFRDNISEWLSEQYSEVRDDAENTPTLNLP